MKQSAILVSATEFVMQTQWGKQLTFDQVARVQADVKELVLMKGDNACQMGDKVEYWKGVMDGLVKMTVASAEGKTSTLTGLASGAWFGEGPVLRSATWDFDGVAMRETRIALVPRSTFEWLLEVSPAFNRFVIAQLNERLAQFISVIEAERLEAAETRVARCLAWLFNPVLYPGVGSQLKLSQQEIAYLSGVSRQKVNRAVKLMEEASLLTAKYGSIQVLNLSGLHKFRP
jgi:CRP/FNR family transcriptional regulator, cyclic AMP receptor protein